MQYMDAGPALAKVSEAVTAGQVLVPDGTTKLVKPSTGASAVVVGVARDAAAPAGSGTAMNFGVLHDEVALLQAPMIVRVKFAADCAYGVRVVSAATGQVTPVGAAAASDGTQVIGFCMEEAGVTSGNFGRIKLV